MPSRVRRHACREPATELIRIKREPAPLPSERKVPFIIGFP
jgi:hypothetical protein